MTFEEYEHEHLFALTECAKKLVRMGWNAARAQSGQDAEASDTEKLRCQQCGNMEPFHATGCKTEFGSYSGATPQPAQQGSVPEPVPDNCLSAKIGEVGNQIHNLGCEHQNDEDLSDRLGKLAAVLWDLAGDAPKQPTKQEWDGEGLPPVGAECRMTLGFAEYDHVKIAHMGDGVFCYLNKRTELEYTGALCDATFRPLKTQHERQRDSLAELCRTKFNQQTSSSNPYLWRQIADAILSRYTLEPKP